MADGCGEDPGTRWCNGYAGWSINIFFVIGQNSLPSKTPNLLILWLRIKLHKTRSPRSLPWQCKKKKESTKLALSVMATPKKRYERDIYSCCLCSDNRYPDRFTDIFSKTGKDCKYFVKINNVIGIEVQKVSKLLTKACRKCEGQLNTFPDFKSKALSIQNELAVQYTTSKRCKSFPLSRSREENVTCRRREECIIS